jgi:hypothetical protein
MKLILRVVVMMALGKTFEACGALHLNSSDKGRDAGDVIQDALRAKSAVDAQYQRMSAAVALARTRFSSAAAGERRTE